MNIDYELLSNITDKQISLSTERFNKVILNKSVKTTKRICANCGKELNSKDRILGIAVSGETKELYHC